MRLRLLLLILIVCILFSFPSSSTPTQTKLQYEEPRVNAIITSDSGIPVDTRPYIVIELLSASIESKGIQISHMLTDYGIINEVVNVSDILVDSKILTDTPVIIIDSSVGSDNGTDVSDSFISILSYCDTPMILLGRSTWILHRLNDIALPIDTALIDTILHSTPDYNTAVFLTHPYSLFLDTSITTEENLELPLESPEKYPHKIVNLTGSSNPATHSALRYTSWPSDIFLFGPEDPNQLNENGRNLLVNTIAFATSLRESAISSNLGTTQASESETLTGALRYFHEPTLSSMYYAIKTMKSVLNSSEWSTWKSNHQDLTYDLLSTLIVDYGSESGFCESVTEGSVELITTAHGLWMVSVMDLESQFSVSELSTYISTRQLANGSFANRIDHTYYALEAMYEAGTLSDLDETTLESWLRDCVIGGEGPYDHWGGVGMNPDTLEHWNLYAFQYVHALNMLGEEHNDKVKLTQRIQSTGNNDGSYNDTVGNMRYHGPVVGTSSALSAMVIMGTLSLENNTSGLTWFSEAQVESGGFGWDPYPADIVGKIKYTSAVADCLCQIDETDGDLVIGIEDYVDSIEYELGFEGMDLLPSLMWTSWLSQASRYARAGGYVNYTIMSDFLNVLAGETHKPYTQYPNWSNLSFILSPEYDYLDANTQYRLESVWTQYFGVTTAHNIGYKISSLQQLAISGYIRDSQDFSGHFRPTKSILGTAHMQYSVVAVESLHLLNALDQIKWRSWLESAILSEYSSGIWDSSGWSLKPYVGQQSAIDYLSTRAALRLGLVTSTMAHEIESTINARIQYTDLWALSRDVATLSLLNTSGFTMNLVLDYSQLKSALGINPFDDGWFNDTVLFQPVFTTDVLEMISILGLRPQLYHYNGCTIEGSVESNAYVNGNVDLDVSITSIQSAHTVFMNAFNQSLQFDNVANSDTLVIPVPIGCKIGIHNISLMIADFGSSRSFNKMSVEIWDSLEGLLIVDNPWVLQGNSINGTISWTRLGESDAGITHIVIELDETKYEYDEVSPYIFSLHSDGLTSGMYNLTVNLTKAYCDELILWKEIVVVEPESTYISTSYSIDTSVNSDITIPWSIHFQKNDSIITSQNVTLEIRDSTSMLVYEDWQISSSSINEFSWNPSIRDSYSFKIIFKQNITLEPCESEGVIYVYENTSLLWDISSQYNQYETVTLTAKLSTESLAPLPGEDISVIINSPSLESVIDSVYITNATGYIEIPLNLLENGLYTLEAQYFESGLLRGSNDTDQCISFSESTLSLEELPSYWLVDHSIIIATEVQDSQSNPIQEESLTVRIILLPSLVILEDSIITNSSGMVSLQWIPLKAGNYLVEALFSGTSSRGSSSDSETMSVKHETQLVVSNSVIQGQVESQLQIEWGLQFMNETYILVELVNLEIWNDTLSLVYYDSAYSEDSATSFLWTPNLWGNYSFMVSFAGSDIYIASSAQGIIEVWEQTQLTWLIPNSHDQYSIQTLTALLETVNLVPIEGEHVLIVITSPSAETVIDSDYTTNATGHIIVQLAFEENGIYILEAGFACTSYLNETYSVEPLISWSTSSLDIGGIQETGLITDTWDIWARLVDSAQNPVVGQYVNITITYLPSTVVKKQTLITNSSGYANLQWQASSVGDYQIEAAFGSTISRDYASELVDLEIKALITLTITHSSNLKVESESWICVTADDGFGLLSGLDVWFTVKNPKNETVLEVLGSTVEGKFNTTWIPSERGWNDITAWSEEQLWFEASSSSLLAVVYEQPIIGVIIPDILANDTADIMVSVSDLALLPVPNANVSITISLNSITILTDEKITDGFGVVPISVYVYEPGELLVHVGLESQGCLLSTNLQQNTSILGRTHIDLNLTGFPIEQGTAFGIIATFRKWDGSLLLNSNVSLGIAWSNGTSITIAELNSTTSGICLLYHEFNHIGDFNVTASFVGDNFQAPATISKIQRVQVVPSLFLEHDAIGIAGESVRFSIWTCDAFGAPIHDRTLNLTILMFDEVVYSIELTTLDSPIIASWIPSDRGIATVLLKHIGDSLILSNTSESEISIMDEAEGDLSLSSQVIDLYEDIIFTYSLTMNSNPNNISILFEILRSDLVNVWEGIAFTNASGIAEISYYANHSYGVLTAAARPSVTEFLYGGHSETDITVMTNCYLYCDFIPSPPIVDTGLNITLTGVDELGGMVDDLEVRVYLWNPSGDEVKLGLFSKYVTKTLVDGNAWVTINPDKTGYYTVNISSSGSSLVHSFEYQFHKIVYCPTYLSISANITEITVNDGISITMNLLDAYNTPLEARIVLTLDGPNSHFIGPLELLTDSEGTATWEGIIDEVGLWTVLLEFDGLGVYLESQSSLNIDAIYGTSLGVAVIDTGDIVAGISPVFLTVFLIDSAGNPLEGRTVNYQVYHDIFGLVDHNYLSMTGAFPEPINITFSHMGNHTIVFSYDGTAHYKPSNMAIRIWVRGTTSLSISNPVTLDRSDNDTLTISILNEVEKLLSPDTLDLNLVMTGPQGEVNLTKILTYRNKSISISLFGLIVGDYILNASIFESYERLGSIATTQFNISTQSRFMLGSSTISGIVGAEHEANLIIIDSLNQSISDSMVYISLYDPEGKEIFGSILSHKTLVEAPEGLIQISWIPQKSGIYRIYGEYAGISFIKGCNKTIEFLVRYSCIYNVLTSEPVTYPDSPSLSFSLVSTKGGITSASINIMIIHANGTRHWLTHLTDSRGKCLVILENMHAGFHEIYLNYSGSEDYTPCCISTNVTVKPDIGVTIWNTENLYTGKNCTILLEVKANGVDLDWNGSIKVTHLEPSGNVVGNWISQISMDAEISIDFIPIDEGEHHLEVFVAGLPVISNYSKMIKFSVSTPVPIVEIPMDISSTPVQIVAVIIPIAVFVVKKRISGWLGSLSGEWEE